jgi:glycosyltransferase involved in cell wall biosynthesis
VLFFARPGLKRRGFDVGIDALKRLSELRPDTRISCFGATDAEMGDVGFPIENLGVLSHEQLARAMNESHVLLSFSLSANISWVPFQGMACGCAVVEADVPGVRDMVRNGENCLLASPSAAEVSDALVRLVDDAALRCRLARTAAHELAERSWESSAAQFEAILLRRCFLRDRDMQDRAQRGSRARRPSAEARAAR